MQFFDPRWIEERFARTTTGQKPRILFVGGDFVRKGGDELLAAWAGGELHRVATLDLVTDWPLNVSHMPGVRVIRDVGSYSSEWTELWRTADVFVMPTRSEAFGVVFQEAAAAGLPTVGTAVNAVPEMVLPQHSGLLVPPRDPHALDALRTLIASAEVRRRYGIAARDRILARADPDEYRRRLRSLIRAAAIPRPPHDAGVYA